MKTNDQRGILEMASRAQFLNCAHCKNTNRFGILALPIFFVSGSPIVVGLKLPLHAKKVDHGSSVQKRKRIL